MSFGRKSIKMCMLLAREETQRSAFLWHAGRMKEELSGVMRMSRLWRSGDFHNSESHRKTVFPY